MRLRRLGEWLHENDRRYLFELLVPATPEQIEAAGGDEDRWDSEERPKLMKGAIEELQAAGVEPDIWKIEGIDRREDCETISAATRAGGRDGVACVVLGRGADDAKASRNLALGADIAIGIGAVAAIAVIAIVGARAAKRNKASKGVALAPSIGGGALRWTF